MKSSALATYLRALRLRLRLRDGWLLAQQTLWVALVGVISILGIGRLIPIGNLFYWAFSCLILWLCANFVFSLFRPRPLNIIAQKVDLELGLKERLSTAIELETRSGPQFSNLPNYQRSDALAAAQSIVAVT